MFSKTKFVNITKATCHHAIMANVRLCAKILGLRCNTLSTCENLSLPNPSLNVSYLCDPANKNDIMNNIKCRKGIGDIERVLQLVSEGAHKDLLLKEMLKIPNRTHPDVMQYGETPHVIRLFGDKMSFTFKPKSFHDIAKSLNLVRNDLSNFTGHKSYFFMGPLAELESALIRYFLKKLLHKGFEVISVPDIVPRSVIESCGMETQGKRSQVYTLDADCYGRDQCLSGTAEIALAAYLAGKEMPSAKLPLRLAAVSRCYRAETSRTSDERGIYRVHQFTKVEMFGVSEAQGSAELLEDFRQFQEENFESLGLHLRVLDMPAHELGAQAYRKYDIEAWLPGKEMWGELSSSSDCTDYQSRRLAMRSDGRFVHTVNGTACAIPRLIIALLETHQQVDGKVMIPLPLRPLMGGASVIDVNPLPPLKLIKRKSQMS